MSDCEEDDEFEMGNGRSYVLPRAVTSIVSTCAVQLLYIAATDFESQCCRHLKRKLPLRGG